MNLNSLKILRIFEITSDKFGSNRKGNVTRTYWKGTYSFHNGNQLLLLEKKKNHPLLGNDTIITDRSWNHRLECQSEFSQVVFG